MVEPGGGRDEPTLEYWIELWADARCEIDALDAESGSAPDDAERKERRRRLTWDSWNISNRISALRNRERQQRGSSDLT